MNGSAIFRIVRTLGYSVPFTDAFVPMRNGAQWLSNDHFPVGPDLPWAPEQYGDVSLQS